MSELKCSAIEKAARFGRDHFALLLAGLGTAHILVRTATYGAAVTLDSVSFLSTATNFLAGAGWRNHTGWMAVGWPPLFPLLLAASGWVGIDPLEAGRWINAAAFGLTILAAGGWLRSNLRSRRLALAATGTIVASVPLTHFAAYLLTDALFALFALLALIQLESFLNRKTTYLTLLQAATCTALTALTRYPGVALIGTGVLMLLPRARLKHTVVFGAVSSMPLLAVLASNWEVSKTLTGSRSDPSGQSLSEGLRQTVAVFDKWLVPPNAPDGLAYLLWLVVGLVGLAGAAAVLRAGRAPTRDAPASFRLGPVLPFGGFALVYILFIVVVVPFASAQGIDSRYLLPVYVPLLLTAAFLLDRFLSIKAVGRMVAARYILTPLVLLGVLAHVGFSVQRNLILTAKAWIAGYEHWTFNAVDCQHSETLEYIRNNRIDGTIYTNNSELAWFADRTAYPGKYLNLPDMSGVWWPEDGTDEYEDGTDEYVVWLHNGDDDMYDDIDIRCLPGLETVAELSDGAVFRRTAAEPLNAEQHRARKERYIEQLIEQAGERVVRSGWDVYRNGRRLIYLKEPCAPSDTEAKFVLHVTPADLADLSSARKRHGFDNLSFYFARHGMRRGVRVGDKCMAIAHLPNYAIGRIRVGQWISKENRTLWEADFLGAAAVRPGRERPSFSSAIP